MRTLLVSLAVLACAAPAFSAGARLSGRVRARPRVRSPKSAYGSKALLRAKLFDYDRLKDLAVWAEPSVPAAGSFPSEATLAVRRKRRGPVFEPSFLALAEGSAFFIDNQTDSTLTLFAGGDSPAGLEVRLSSGTREAVRLPASGLYRLSILEAPEASALVLRAGRYIAEVGASGRYELRLPAGSYKVTAWHPRLPSQSREVRLAEGESASVDFTLSVQELPEVP